VYLSGEPDASDVNAWWNWVRTLLVLHRFIAASSVDLERPLLLLLPVPVLLQGSFITGVTNSSNPPGPHTLPPCVNVSGFLLRPERVGVGIKLGNFNCTADDPATECIVKAAKHCLALNSCGGFSYCAPCHTAMLYSGGIGLNGTVSECGNTEWNFWCKPGRCGPPCADGPFSKPSMPWRTIELGDGDWQSVSTPNKQSISMMYKHACSVKSVLVTMFLKCLESSGTTDGRSHYIFREQVHRKYIGRGARDSIL
jgi:hypothetical protein